MGSEGGRAEHSDRPERRRRIDRDGTRKVDPEAEVREEERAIRTIQRTLGNQAIQGLSKSGELEQFLSSRRQNGRPGSTVGTTPEGGTPPRPSERETGGPVPDAETPTSPVEGVGTTDTPAVGAPPVVEAPVEESVATGEPAVGSTPAPAAVDGTTPSEPIAAPAIPARSEDAATETAAAVDPAREPATPSVDVESPEARSRAETTESEIEGTAEEERDGSESAVDQETEEEEAEERELEAPETAGTEADADERGAQAVGSTSTDAGPAAETETAAEPAPARESTEADEDPLPMVAEEPTEAVSDSSGPDERAPAGADTPTVDQVRPAAPPAPGGGTRAASELSAQGIQPKLSVGRPNDRFEREADAVAAAVTAGGPPPVVSTLRGGGPGVRPLEEEQPPAKAEEELLQTRTGIGGPGTGRVPSSTASTIRSPGSGRSLPRDVRSRIEPRLGADLGGVRVHTGPSAARAAGSLGARAFTHGSHVFLGAGQSTSDVELMAHEATHVVQQESARTTGGGPTADVQGLIPDWVLEELNDYARYIPGWTLFTVIIGFNPLTGTDVERTPINLVEGLLGLLPAFGPLIFDALQKYGVLQSAFDWISGELDRLDLSLGRLERTIEAAWEDVSIVRGLDYNVGVLERHFGALYADVVSFASSVVDEVMRMIKEAVVGVAERLLAESETLSAAWELLKKVLGWDPLRDEEVAATPTEILEDFLLLIGQEEHLEQMRERGTLEETAEWIATQIERFEGLLGQLSGLITRVWEAIQPENLPNLASSIESLISQVGSFLQGVWDFAYEVASEVLRRIKDALLGWLSEYAHEIPGFHLLTVIIGKNPFTDEPVPRTAENLIRGFITLLPGGGAIYQQLAETGVIEGAAGRIEAAMSELGISWEFVVGLFTDLWESLSIEDLSSPLETFARVVERFGEPISRLFAFVNVVLREVFFLVLQVMNFPTDIVESIIINVMSAIADIRRDPISFLTNMLGAIKLGLENFFGNVLTHLAGGLVDWLFRGLRDAGVEPPTDLSLESVLDFVLEVLGVTTERLWELLAERIGQENVDRIRGAIDRLTGVLEFVGDVQERGVVAIWEYIQGQITGLWDMVLAKAQEWIMQRIIGRAVQWLLSLLDPTGIMAVVNSVQSFIGAIQSAVEYARDILAIVADYTSTIAAVARGEVGPGAAKLEEGLANAIPIVLGFLARQLGLGNIGEKIAEIVGGIRSYIDKGLNWLVDKAVSAVQSLLRTLGFGEAAEEEEDAEPLTEEGAQSGDAEKIPEGLPPEAIKTAVISMVRERLLSQDVASIQAVHGAVRSIYDANRERGLKSLRIRVEDSSTMAVAIEASASEPAGRRIAWEEIFTQSELDANSEIDDLREKLSKASQASYAAVAVDGKQVGSFTQSGDGTHAEEALVRGPAWTEAITSAREGVQNSGSARVTLMINRTPCASCVQWLTDAIIDAKARLGPAADDVTFVLAATGTYRRQARMKQEDKEALKTGAERMAKRLGRPFDEVYREQEQIWQEDLRSFSTEWVDDDGETYSGLSQLAGAGWQIAGLDAGQPLTARQLELSQIAARLADEFGWDS